MMPKAAAVENIINRAGGISAGIFLFMVRSDGTRLSAATKKLITLQVNILTVTFLLVSSPTHFKIYCGLCTVKAKNANKNV